MALTVSLDEIIGGGNPLLGIKLHWSRIRLGDIGEVLNGFAFKAELFTREGGMPLIRIRDVGRDASETFYSGEFDERYVVNVGDLLVGMDGDFNCARWRGPRSLLNQRVCKIKVDESVYLPRFLDYVLPGYLKAINDATSSVTVKHLSSRTIQDIPLPLPPMEEQREIVAELEKQFSRLDEAVANLQRVKANLKRYKASVLKSAVEGSLTEGNVDAFRRLRLGELVEVNPRLPKGSLDDTSPVSFVPMAAVGADDGCLDVTAIRSYSEVRKGYTCFADGDVLFAKVTPCMENGKIAIAKGLVGGIGFGSTEFHVMRPRHDVDSRYVYCIVSSESFRKEAARHMTGAVGLRRVPTAFLESVEVSVPPLDQQLLVVSEVDRQLTIIQEIEAEVDVNLQRSKVLRQATLAKAFLNR